MMEDSLCGLQQVLDVRRRRSACGHGRPRLHRRPLLARQAEVDVPDAVAQLGQELGVAHVLLQHRHAARLHRLKEGLELRVLLQAEASVNPLVVLPARSQREPGVSVGIVVPAPGLPCERQTSQG